MVVLFVWVRVRVRVRDRDGLCWIAMQAGCSYGYQGTRRHIQGAIYSSVCRDGSVRSYGVDVIWMLLAQRGITKARSRMYVLRALAFDDRTEQHVSIYLGEDQIVHVF